MKRHVAGQVRLLAVPVIATALAVSTTAAWAQDRDDAPSPGPTAATSAHPAIRPAPAGFRQQIIDAYAGIPALRAAYPGATVAPGSGTSAFAKQVRSLSPHDLDVLYSAAPDIWRQIRAAVSAAPLPGSAFHASSATPPEKPADPEHANCKTGEALHAMRLTASALERAANVIDIALDFIDDEEEFSFIPGTPPEKIASPLYFIPFTIKSGIEGAAASILLDADLEDWCKGGNEASLNDYLSGDAPHLLFAFDQQLVAGYEPILQLIEGTKKQLEDRETSTQQHLAEAASEVQEIEQKTDDSLHTTIEAALNGDGFSSLLLLPASKGGYLDATPVGVQQIVTEALATMQAAKQPISSAGPRYLSLANDKLAAGQYKQAFHYYQLAYREIAKY